MNQLRYILFITGPHASGKSSLSRHVLASKGFMLFDTGPILRQLHQSEDPHTTFSQWLNLGEQTHGKEFTDTALTTHIKMAIGPSVQRIAVIGNRSYRGVTYLQRELTPAKSSLIYVDAPKAELFQRYKHRDNKPNLTMSEFDTILESDIKMGLHALQQEADLCLHNTSSPEQARAALDKYVESCITSL